MNTSKKSRFATFMLSLIPGAAHMYMGFMKMGLSMMGLFALAISIVSMLNLGVLSLIIPLIWFYSFFHVHNIAYLSDEDFAKLEDAYLFGIDNINQTQISAEKYRKYIGIGLITFGIILLWNVTMNRFIPQILHFLPEFFYDIFWRVSSLVPQLVVAILIIIVGIKMLKGKKKDFPGLEDKNGK